MDDIIQKIIGFEQKAQSIVEVARGELRSNNENMRLEIEAYRAATHGEKDSEIADCISLMNREADEAIKHLEDAAKLKIIQMQRKAAEQRDEWIERLYSQIVGGDAS
ncbi:MAG: hypothetical protein FWH01_05470 [Oscillospiraceae bacterium]|nr:hypothetical protein [Oscillospiraceae bacterium]